MNYSINIKQNQKWVYFLLILVVFVLYSNSIKNDYSLDDHLVNKSNELTQVGIKGIPEIFKNYSFHEKQLSYTYRPLLITSFAIEYSLFGVNPHISHFISILLYALLVMLIYYFLLILFTNVNDWIKLITVILFIVYPLHTELVDNIKSRDELLVGIFGFLILIHFIKYLNDNKKYRLFLVFLFVVAGILTKLSIVIYIGIIPFLYLYHYQKSEKKNWFPLVLSILIVLVTFVSLHYFKQLYLPNESVKRNLFYFENPLILSSFSERIPSGLVIGLYNFKLLFWPFNLVYYYGYNHVPIIGWKSVFPYLSILFYIVFIFIIIKNFKNKFFLSLGGIILLTNIIAVSNIFILLPGIVAERFIFFGSLGFIMMLVFVVFNLFRRLNWLKIESSTTKFKLQAILLTLLIIIILSIKVYSRNKIWADEFTLISTDINLLSNSAKANDMLSYQLFGKIKTEKNELRRNFYINDAIKYSQQCLFTYPNYTTCWNNLGTLYYIKQDFSKAEACFKKAVSIDKTDANPLFNLGNIYQRQLKVEQSRLCYEKALENNPTIVDLIPVYKQFIIKNNKVDESIIFILKLTEKYPKSYDLHLLLVDFYSYKNDPINMLFYLNKAYQIKPTNEITAYIKQVTVLINKNLN